MEVGYTDCLGKKRVGKRLKWTGLWREWELENGWERKQTGGLREEEFRRIGIARVVGIGSRMWK